MKADVKALTGRLDFNGSDATITHALKSQIIALQPLGTPHRHNIGFD
ncbi:hypothetical protein [Dyella nitratireducens]|nr:hypothetical protein [Dyella nitratireducens]